MSDHDDAQDYTANGPTDIGFRTGGDGTGIANGVVAHGTQIGVHGISSADGQGSDFFGVFGESFGGVGVLGKSTNQAGVMGITDLDVGVQGFAGKTGTGVEGVGDSGIGVNGRSSSNDGIVGTTGGERKSGVFGDNTERQLVSFGVSGRCQSVQGAGVNGFSQAGVGVRGSSDSNDAVVGVSGGDRKSGVFGDHTDTTRVTFGVSGRCLSPQGSGVNGFSVPGVGVRGTSTANDGIVGTSAGERKSGVFGDNGKTTGAAFGVSGRSQSPEGAGVFGFSDVGYGGQFSGARAPLRLQPATTIGRPTTGSHQTGEFFVDGNGELFFCKLGGTPGSWFHVLLGE